MFKKILVVSATMLISVTTFANISLTGKYTGTLDSHGTYTQDITTTMRGISGNSAVTVVLDEAFEVDDMYVETTVGDLTFKLGDSSGSDPDVIKLGVTATVGDYTIGLNQESGGATTIDAGAMIGGIKVNTTNITNDARKTTAAYTIAGLDLGVTHQKVGSVNQIQSDVSTVVGATEGIGGFTLTGDVNQNAARDAFEDGSYGGSISTAVNALGTVKAKGHMTSADVKTYSLAVTRGIWTAEWEKAGSADGVTSLEAVLTF
jgi:hypothetical protein